MWRLNSQVIFAFSCVLLFGIDLSAQRASSFGSVPLYFEENRGQTDAQARYIARSPNLVGFVTQDGWTLSLHGQPVSMHIADANAKAAFVPEQPAEGVTNYYLGSRAITNLAHYSSVRAKNIRPGIDVIYHGNERELEYDLVVHPGADLQALWLRFDGSRPVLADNGDILLTNSKGEVRQRKPRVWQEANGRRVEVECSYVIAKSGRVGFVFSNYDQSAELIVDPIVSYSTYLSGTKSDSPFGIAVDSSGSAYATGTTASTDFPVTFGTYQGGGDVFVAKLNPSGTGLVYSTFIGGTAEDIGRAIAIDNAGNAYVTGGTSSLNFPVTVNQFTPGTHAFALKLGATGSLMYSTALAGNNFDSGSAIATDIGGSAYVAGATSSTNFPVTAGSYQTAAGGFGDGFVAKLNVNGQILYATYLGGNGTDSAAAIAVDASGNAFVGGVTASSNFPTTAGAYDTSIGGSQDAFVVKLNAAGSALVYATFLGGSSTDYVNGLAIDAAGNCYVTGNTQSANFPTTPGAYSTIKGSADFVNAAFVSKLNAAGTALVYSTFLSGFGNDSGVGIAVDSSGYAYVAGTTQSPNFPTSPGALKAALTFGPFSCCDTSDMFLAKVSLDGAALAYSTLLGSTGVESLNGLALDGMGGVYVVGLSDGLRYPTTAGAYQTVNPKGSGSAQSTVISKVDFNDPTLCNPSVAPQSQGVPEEGGPISFNLTLAPGCPWEVAFYRTELVLNGPRSGVMSTSPMAITGAVVRNDFVTPLAIQVGIGTAMFTAIQDSGSCQDPVISPSSVAFDSSGGMRDLSVTLPSACNGVAVAGAPWLSVINPAGRGSRSITIIVGQNSFSARSTTLNISGKSITVTQSGSTCTATASIAVSGTSAQGSDGVISMATSSSACTWTAYAAVPWIQLHAPTTRQGSEIEPFIVAANPGIFPRTGQILIADITLSVTQDAGPAGTITGYTISPFAGQGIGPGLGDGGPALDAHVQSPIGLACDPLNDNLYISENFRRVRVVTSDGKIHTFAGGGSGTGENIPATSASIQFTTQVAVDHSSAVYVNVGNRVRKISQGNIVTFAGGEMAGFGGDNGPAINALLSSAMGIAADSAGNVYISDNLNKRVRKVSGGTITTFAGGGTNRLGDNGPATSASLTPYTLAVDAASNLLIVDGPDRVRKVAQGIITTAAGGGTGGDGGPATSAALYGMHGIAVGTQGDFFVSQDFVNTIRRVSADGTINTVVNSVFAEGLAIDRSGNIYTSDFASSMIFKAAPLTSFCTYSVTNPLQIPPAGGPVQITVTTSPGCHWGALLLPTWLTANGATTGVGSGTITLTAAANPNTYPRLEMLAVAGMPVIALQVATASLFVSSTHSGNLFPSQQNATFTITVSNSFTASATTGQVTVTDTLPSGLILVGMSGPGWTCQNTTCARSDVLNPSAAYPAITLTVKVAANATSSQLNQVTVSGGGSAPYTGYDSAIVTTATLLLNHSTLNFASSNGIVTSPQTVRVSFTGGAAVLWGVSSSSLNIVASLSSGVGNGSFQVSASAGPSGIITVYAPEAMGTPKQIQVNVSSPSPGVPFGSFDTPANNTSGVAGAIPVTGWALDAVEVVKVDIWREPVGGEPAGGLILIGDAVFVEGARPDVEGLYPTLPFNYRAGWGYQMLTNFLPNGNGTFKLHAIAHNKAGSSMDLGTKTIVVDNAHASKPFGTIDTPGQGGTASGNAFVNFGWALTPNPNKIPIDGSTITVVIDGAPVGHPTYNQFRSDIANLFPGLMNSGGAVGFFYIDTTTLASGVHTISWNVFDNARHGEGLGSRYFSVFNSGGGPAAEPEEPLPNGRGSDERNSLQTRNRAATVRERTPGIVEIEEVGLVELPLGATSGYELVNGERRPLPIGSSLKRGVFYWQPGPGFLGEYQLVFEREDGTEVHARVRIGPKTYPRGR